MKGLLQPTVESEVDFAEATNDGSNILARWMAGDAAGMRAFIPECYATVKIFSCTVDEAKQICGEYIWAFDNDDGMHIYSELIGMI